MKEDDEEDSIENKNDNKEIKEKEEADNDSKDIPKQIIEIKNKAEEDDNSTLIVKSKIKELKDNYNFYIKYYEILFNMIKYLEELTYEKIANSINDSANYISFFNTSSGIYSNFAEQIKKSKEIITSSKKLPKMNDSILYEVMENTQNIIHLNLSKISDGLKQNIIANGPFAKYQEKISKIESIKKEHFLKINEIEDKNKNVVQKYAKSYETLFEIFSQEKNNNEDINNSLVDFPDLIFIKKDLLDEINDLILQINLFTIDAKDSLYSINVLFVEINNLVRDSVLIYIQESKNIFNIDVTKNFEKIQKYYKSLEDNPEDKIFKLDKIFNEQDNKDKIYNLLEQYYNLLNNSGRGKKDLVSDRNNFSIRKYQNLYLFFEWLISISPQPNQMTTDDLIIKKVEVRRYSGFFGGWKESMMIFTKQKHIILYDKDENDKFENIFQIFEIDKTTFQKKLDYKKFFLFEISINSKGKIMNFTGTYQFDALNNENLNDISFAYKDYIKQ